MHYTKYGKAAVGSILMHSDRGICSPDTHEHSNENIDRSRTHLNYDLKERGGQTAYAYYKQRIDQIAAETKGRTGKSIRKDAVTLCSWAVTAPKDLPEAKLPDFFKAAYDWFVERYGEDNIVTAAVHMDETTPHMHLQFTPIIEKEGMRKLCAKDMETRKTLQTAHQKLQSHLEQALGCEVNILNGATEQGNKSVLELQNETLKQQLAEKEEKAHQAEKRAEQAEQKLAEVNAKHEIANRELQKVVERKAKAAKVVNLNPFSEKVTFHKNMYEALLSIRDSCYDNEKLANEKLQQAEAMAMRAIAMKEAVAPLERQAQEEYRRAKELREKQEQLIEQKAEEIAKTRVLQGMRGIATDRTQRLESYCRQLKFGDGTTALDKFEELEQERERQALGRVRVPKRNRGFER